MTLLLVYLIVVITESPQATNISANGVAEFDCSASASSGTSIIIVWEVDGSQKLETNSHYHGNIIKSILRLPASSVNNTATTNIECILYTNVNNTPKKIDYKTVPLMIQGKLSCFKCKIIHFMVFIVSDCLILILKTSATFCLSHSEE